MKIDKASKRTTFEPEDYVITLVPDEGLRVVKLGDLFTESGEPPRSFEIPTAFTCTDKALNEYYTKELLATGTDRARDIVKEAKEKGVVAQLPNWALFDDPSAEMGNLFNAIEGGAKLAEAEFIHNSVLRASERPSAAAWNLQRSLLDIASWRLGGAGGKERM